MTRLSIYFVRDRQPIAMSSLLMLSLLLCSGCSNNEAPPTSEPSARSAEQIDISAAPPQPAPTADPWVGESGPPAVGVDHTEFCSTHVPDAILAKYKLKRSAVTSHAGTVICDAENPGTANVTFMFRCEARYANEAHLEAEARAVTLHAVPYKEVAGIGEKAYRTRYAVLFLSGKCEVRIQWFDGPQVVDLARDIATAQPR
jgi:hypothetical protein